MLPKLSRANFASPFQAAKAKISAVDSRRQVADAWYGKWRGGSQFRLDELRQA